MLTHLVHATSGLDSSFQPQVRPEILEKPISKADNLRMLLDLNGGVCEVVTGVSLGTRVPYSFVSYSTDFGFDWLYLIQSIQS